jgi:signal transduction histidine kinase
VDSINFFAVNSYIALVAAVVNFTLALLTILRTSRETVYVTFSMICAGVAWWNFWDFMVYASGNPLWLPLGFNTDTPWKNIVAIGSTLAAAALFHFTVALIGRLKGNLKWVISAYILSVPIAISPVIALYSEPVNLFWTGKGWNLSFFILLFPFMLASFILLTGAYVKGRGTEEAEWLKYILAALVIQVVTGMTDLFHKIFPVLPPLGHLGSVIGPIVFATGVYRHRQAFDVLAQTRGKLELVSRMAAEVAHEVRNPLTAVKGVARLLETAAGGGEGQKIHQYQEIVTEEIERIETILGNLQDLTKPMKVVKEEVDMNSIIEKTLQLTSVGELELATSFTGEQDLPHVEADPSLMKQVILNIVRNASDACGQDGKLEINTMLDHDFLRIEFTDNGPGVSEDVRSRIFEPFFTTKSTGLGLGLVVIQRIMEAHGGRVSMDNIHPSGARVTVLIPR